MTKKSIKIFAKNIQNLSKSMSKDLSKNPIQVYIKPKNSLKSEVPPIGERHMPSNSLTLVKKASV